MAITIEQLADELGVGARRVQRWVDRRLGYSIVTKPSEERETTAGRIAAR